MKEKTMPNEKKVRSVNYFLIILLSIIFSAAASIAALLIARPYFTPITNIITTGNQTNSSQDNLRQANSIIENAKKIIANQQNKVNDTITASQNSLVGVFKKNQAAAATTTADTIKNFDIAKYYKLSDAISEGIVVTSDGWVLTPDFTKNSQDSSQLKNFVIITKTNSIYNIDKISQTGINSYIFVHLSNAKDLPVKSFVSKMDLSNSQSLVALNWRGESYLTSIVDKLPASQAVKDSDASTQNIVFANNLGDYFDNAFIFSLDNQVVGYFDKKDGPVPIYNFQPLIDGLLQGKESKRPSLGVTYVNLQEYAIKDVRLSSGALIYSDTKVPAVKNGGAAALAGLQTGDIIISVDNVNIDALHDLGDILEKYSAGDSINIIYLRNGAENAATVKLQEIK